MIELRDHLYVGDPDGDRCMKPVLKDGSVCGYPRRYHPDPPPEQVEAHPVITVHASHVEDGVRVIDKATIDYIALTTENFNGQRMLVIYREEEAVGSEEDRSGDQS